MAAGTMTWTEVAGRLAAARTYWLGSTTASGAPHAASRSATSIQVMLPSAMTR